MARPLFRRPRLSRPVLWAGLCVVAAAVTVQLTGAGVDVLALMVAGFFLLLLERTLGDWIADSLGSAATALVFAGVAACGVLYTMTAGGRAKVQFVFSAAEARGYHTTFFTLDDAKDTLADEVGLPDAVRDATDAVTPTAADGRVGSPLSRGTSAGGPPSSRVPTSARRRDAGSTARSPASSVAGGPDVSGGAATTATGEEQVEDGAIRIVRLVLNPEIVMTGDRVTLRAIVTGRSEPPALIEFSIDGHTVSTAPIGRDGIAKAMFATRTPGQYTVRARIVGGPFRITEVSALLSVLPGGR